jgi:hypothetical protein
MSQHPTPLSESLLQVLGHLAQVLNDRQTDYALIGGLGVALRGTIRATRDIEMLLSVPQTELVRLLESLCREGFQVDVREAIRQWSRDNLLAMAFGQVRIDWVRAVLPVFQRVLRRSRWEAVGDQTIRVADAEGLLLLKLISFRPRDQEDIRGILATNPGTLDLDWVRHEWSLLAKLDEERTSQFEAIVRELGTP